MRRHFIYLAYGCYLMHMWTQGQLTVIPVLDRAPKLWDTELGDLWEVQRARSGANAGAETKGKELETGPGHFVCGFVALGLNLKTKWRTEVAQS